MYTRNSEIIVKNESISLPIDSISRIDVANGKTGDFVLLENEDTYNEILKVIQENKYIPKQEEEGWTIGIRIYSGGKHYWFTPTGLSGYNYENPNLFKELLLIISDEIKIDFVESYLN